MADFLENVSEASSVLDKAPVRPSTMTKLRKPSAVKPVSSVAVSVSPVVPVKVTLAQQLSQQAEQLRALQVELRQTKALVAELSIQRIPATACPLDETEPPVNISTFEEHFQESELLRNIYGYEGRGTTECILSRVPLTEECVGTWPSKFNQQCGSLYLGMPNEDNAIRRTRLIPWCIANDIPFFTPQGTGENQALRPYRVIQQEGLAACGSAVFCFQGESQSIYYNTGADLLHLVGEKFANIFFVCFPYELERHLQEYDNGHFVANVWGPLREFTRRQRQQEYYQILRQIVDFVKENQQDHIQRDFASLDVSQSKIMQSFQQLLCSDMLHLLSGHHRSWVRYTLDQVIAVYNRLTQTYHTDIGRILILMFGTWILRGVHGADATRKLALAQMVDHEEIDGQLRTLLDLKPILIKRANELDETQHLAQTHHLLAVIDLMETITVQE